MTFQEAEENVKRYRSIVVGTPLINMFGEKEESHPITHIVIAQYAILKEIINKMGSEFMTNEQAILEYTHVGDDFDVFVVSRENPENELLSTTLEGHLKKMALD